MRSAHLNNQKKRCLSIFRLPSLLLLLLLALFLVSCGNRHPYDFSNLSSNGIWKRYEDSTFTSRAGIDLSQWNESIDWETLMRETPVSFAILKIGYRGSTEGQLYTDPMFEEYWEGANSQGLDLGVYFYSQAINEEEAIEEADYLLAILNGRKLALPVAYDLEVNSFLDSTRIDHLSGSQMTKNAYAFCRRIEEAGYTAMLYTNKEWIKSRWDRKLLEDYPVWYAQYDAKPQTSINFSIWQYTCEPLPGTNVAIDLDLQFLPKE